MKWDEYRHNFDGVPVFFIKRLVQGFGCVVQIHKFVKADAEGCFHSHPAWAFRLVLWGGYVEETGDGRWCTWFPGRCGIVRPDFEHRIGGLRNGRSSFSLWLRGPRVASINVRGCDEPALQPKVTGSAMKNGEAPMPGSFADNKGDQVV
jgi:hypothetical protein